MARRITERGLLLSRHPYGESSLVVHALTARQGRISLLAKGAYRPRSGYFGVLDLFDTLELEWTPAPSALGLLRGARILRRRRGLTADPLRFRSGLAMLELAAQGAREGCSEGPLLGLCEVALDRLDAGTPHPDVVLARFDLGWLGELGLAPVLERCAACDRPAPGPRQRPGTHRARFSPAQGGLLCARCAAELGPSDLSTPSWGLVRACRSLGALEWERLEGVSLAPALRTGVRATLDRFLEHHLERRLRARSALSSRSWKTPQDGWVGAREGR